MEPGQKKKKLVSPTKSMNMDVQSVIDLTSDEDDEERQDCCNVDLNQSTSSSFNAAQKGNKTPSTPIKYRKPATKTKNSQNKKRKVEDGSTDKENQNLDLSLGCFTDEDILKLINGLNDTTIFLIEIIYQFLKDANLRPLLKEESLNLLENSKQVIKPGMRLVCRLYWQQEQWYHWKKLRQISKTNSDVEIDDPSLQEAINSLIENGYIEVINCTEPNHGFNFDALVQILDAGEVIKVGKEFNLKPTSKKDAIHLLNSFSKKKKDITAYLMGGKSDNEKRVLMALSNRVGSCYRLKELVRTTLRELYILMYIGMDNSNNKDKLEYLLFKERTNKETFPTKELPVDSASVIFKSRQEFEQYFSARIIHDEYLNTTMSSKKCVLVNEVYNLYKAISEEEMMSYTALPVWLHQFTRPYIYVEILEKGIADLKNGSRKDIHMARKILTKLINQNVFKQHEKAEWYAEKALILDKLLDMPEEAGEVLLEGLSSNLHEQGKELLRPRALNIARRETDAINDSLRLKLTQWAKNHYKLEKNIKGKYLYEVPMDFGTGKLKFRIHTTTESSMVGAEEYCIHYYINKDDSEYNRGEHWGGRIIKTMFFLLFWDIIYANLRGLRGLFLSRYQRYPLDMFCECFYTNRKSLIDERLMEIKNSTVDAVVERMQATWNSRPECEQSDISRSIGWDNVKEVTSCLRPKRVAALCQRLARDYRYSHSGFPDLTLWNVDTHQIIFVKVKTDSEKPSVKQLQWMNYLKKHDMKVEYCYVGYTNWNPNYMEDSD